MSPGSTVLDRVETVILGRYNCSKYLLRESRYFTLSLVSLNASVMLLRIEDICVILLLGCVQRDSEVHTSHILVCS